MTATGQVAACHDELGRKPVAPQITGALGVVDTNGEVLVDFEMEVSRVHAVVIADGADLLAAGHLLAFAHGDPVKVRVEGVCEMELAFFDPGVAHDDHVPPGDMNVPGQHDQAVPDGMDGLSKTAGAAAVGDEPVLTKVPSGPESPGLVISLGVGRRHREVEAVGGFGDALGAGRAETPHGKNDEEGRQSMEIPYLHESYTLERRLDGCKSCMD